MSVFNTFEDFEAFGIRDGHLQSALQDAWLDYSQSGDISMREFFKARKETHPHRYKTFVADTNNVGHAAIFSLAAQGAFLREHGEAATVELLKTQGLKLGQVKPAPKADATTGSNNPYSSEFKGTEAQREARIQSLIKSSATLAGQLAKAAGKTLTNQPLRKVGR